MFLFEMNFLCGNFLYCNAENDKVHKLEKINSYARSHSMNKHMQRFQKVLHETIIGAALTRHLLCTQI